MRIDGSREILEEVIFATFSPSLSLVLRETEREIGLLRNGRIRDRFEREKQSETSETMKIWDRKKRLVVEEHADLFKLA